MHSLAKVLMVRLVPLLMKLHMRVGCILVVCAVDASHVILKAFGFRIKQDRQVAFAVVDQLLQKIEQLLYRFGFSHAGSPVVSSPTWRERFPSCRAVQVRARKTQASSCGPAQGSFHHPFHSRGYG